MGTEVTKYEEKWLAAGEDFASKEKSDSNFIKLAGGILKIGDAEVDGNKLCCIIVDSVYENTYYDEKWTQDGPVMPPKCFALAHDQDDLAPHPAMEADLDYFYPQSYDEETEEVLGCSKCPKNEWGSADTGKGKACGNRRRLALIQAGEYVNRGSARKPDWELVPFEDEDDYKSGSLYMLKLPVTSGKAFSRFVKEALRDYGRPPYGVVCEISVRPDAKTQIAVEFEVLDAIPDDWFPMIQKRHEEAREAIMKPYEPPQEQDDEPAPKNRISGLRRN